MNALKSEGSTGPRRLFAAAQRRDSSPACVITARLLCGPSARRHLGTFADSGQHECSVGSQADRRYSRLVRCFVHFVYFDNCTILRPT